MTEILTADSAALGFSAMEIFTLVTGVLFLILEIRQSGWMWLVQVLSGAAACVMFFRGGLYASFALNLYYVVIALWGVLSWKRDAGLVADAAASAGVKDAVLRRGVSPCRDTDFVGWKDDCVSLAPVKMLEPEAMQENEEVKSGATVKSACSKPNDEAAIHIRHLNWKIVAVSALLQIAGTALLIWILRLVGDTMSGLDAAVAVLSLIATWWLVRTYKEQWLLWVLADILYTVMCWGSGMHWMSVLYAFYTLSAVYGYIHWTRKGVYVE